MNNLGGTLESVPIGQLNHYSRNPRKGDVQAIKESLKAHGLYKPLLVNSGAQTGEQWAVLAGNHTLAAMRELNEEAKKQGCPEPYSSVPVYIIDVDAEEAARIVLVDNRISDQATYNDEQLLNLLEWLPELDGTGYSLPDLDSLRSLIDELEPEEQSEEVINPYDDFVTVRLQLPPLLAKQWLVFSTAFDSSEEALEHLLDHATCKN